MHDIDFYSLYEHVKLCLSLGAFTLAIFRDTDFEIVCRQAESVNVWTAHAWNVTRTQTMPRWLTMGFKISIIFCVKNIHTQTCMAYNRANSENAQVLFWFGLLCKFRKVFRMVDFFIFHPPPKKKSKFGCKEKSWNLYCDNLSMCESVLYNCILST